ncbi:MAG TPA: hypothetical protein DD636_03690 [Anaerolineaceae bacterium]|jgi:hypothetical protein|nr:hypothetical protein [Anaerolineaceae bacterium]
MKIKKSLWLSLLLLTLILSACVPLTFSPPAEIHITDGDQVENAVIAVDAAGRSHIAGVVADRIVYYRTRYGEELPLGKITMVMSGSGTNWKQYNPDIAVVDDGMAFVTWVEQRGGTEKFACYQQIPLIPPVGGYDKDCDPLDGTEQTAGNVWVTAHGSTAYAVYDRPDIGGRTADLWYKRIAGGSVTGRVAWFIENFETVDFYSLDLGIDESGFLHVGYHYNWTTGGPPAGERLEIRSNRSTLADGQMDQIWIITTSSLQDEDIPVRLSFYQDGTTQRVALASVFQPATLDQIWVDSCTAVGCTAKADIRVDLPTSWDTFSVVDDVEIEGIDETLFLSFIGDDNTAPTGAPQVYYTDAHDTSTILEPSEGSATFKFDLEMTTVKNRVDAPFVIPVMAWAESNFVTATHFVAGFYTPAVKISEDNCTETMVSGNIASNDIYLSGVWDACSNTWFTTQAWNTQLPLITK